jgi:hypothetical protein
VAQQLIAVGEGGCITLTDPHLAPKLFLHFVRSVNFEIPLEKVLEWGQVSVAYYIPVPVAAP